MKTAQQRSVLIIITLALWFVVLISFGCTSKITINAEVNFADMGGLRPLAKQTIYLLSDSITSHEMEEAFRKYMATTTPPVKPGIPLAENEIRTRAGFMISDGRAIWHRYIIESIETDHKGRGKFKKTFKPGDYWVYSITKRPSGQWLIWNVKATVAFYENTNVKLSNENILN